MSASVVLEILGQQPLDVLAAHEQAPAAGDVLLGHLPDDRFGYRALYAQLLRETSGVEQARQRVVLLWVHADRLTRSQDIQ